MEAVMNNQVSEQKKKSNFISKPLFKQSLKSNWVIWTVLTIASVMIFVVINLAVGSKNLFTNINMDSVTTYVKDENLSWLTVLGLLEQMGFNLTRIQVMSQIDLNSVVSELIYKICGVLLPMIYIMIVSNKLIAAQVSDGSMAYVLSTPTNRKTVVRTQYLFLFLSVTLMYVAILVGSLSSEAIANLIATHKNPEAMSNWVPLKPVIFAFASYCAILGLSGICFGASAFFNKSSNSVAAGGGVCIMSFLCCILGLFGNPVFVAVGIGVEAMYFFNYLSLFTLIDTTSISNFANAVSGKDAVISYNWMWELAIVVVIGLSFAYVGARVFVKKDLPL